MEIDRLAFYNIPKDVIEQFKRRFEESEKIAFPQLTEAEKYGIYKFMFERIRIFLEYSEFFKEQEKKDWTPSGVYTKKEQAELKQSYKHYVQNMATMFQAAGLEGDWILRKIVGSPQKMEAFRKRHLAEDNK